MGSTVVGRASTRTDPVVRSSTRPASPSSPSNRLSVACCTPVPDRSASAEPASSAWSRSRPVSPVRTTTASGSAVRTGSLSAVQAWLRSSTMPVCGSTEVIA